jgi:hypothetical protein
MDSTETEAPITPEVIEELTPCAHIDVAGTKHGHSTASLSPSENHDGGIPMSQFPVHSLHSAPERSEPALSTITHYTGSVTTPPLESDFQPYVWANR